MRRESSRRTKLPIIFLLAILSGCGEKQVEVPLKILLASTTLATGDSAIHPHRWLTLPERSTLTITNECPDDTYPYCVTPLNISGGTRSLSIRVGEGSESLSLPVLDGSDALIEFDLATQTLHEGVAFSCCDGVDYPADSRTSVSAIEWRLGYIELHLDFLNGEVPDELAGSHKFRIALEDVSVLGYLKGDLLWKDTLDGKFKWCNDSHCRHSSRPSDAYQYQPLLDAALTESGKAALFALTLSSDPAISMDRDSFMSHSWSFALNLTATNAVGFTEDPRTIGRMGELIRTLRLRSSLLDDAMSDSAIEVDLLSAELTANLTSI
jgi:hypothetical protein